MLSAAHVGDDDVFVELGFEFSVGRVAVGGGDHLAGRSPVGLASDVDGVALEVLDSSGDSGLEGLLAELAGCGVSGRPEDREGLGCGEGDVVGHHDLGLVPGGDESFDLGSGHHPAVPDLLGIEIRLVWCCGR